MGGIMTRIIERNTTIPVRRSEIFSTAEDNQPAVDIHVLQGEREMARDNRSLGQFKLEGIPPAPRGIPQIEVTFDIDANGILKVTAKDKGTGKEQQVTISGSSNLDKGEIEKMINEAEAFKAEDRRRREEAEKRNQADALVYQVERQLNSVADQLPTADKARLEAKLEQLKQAIKDGSSVATLDELMNELNQAAAVMANAGAKASQPGGAAQADSDDIIDAEYEEK
jgi:molecular chaperone DnaK